MNYGFRKVGAMIMSFMVMVGCAGGETEQKVEKASKSFNLEEVREIIQEKNRQFTEAHITRDTALLNNMFAEDARGLPPGMDAVSGRKQIAALNWEWVNYGIHEFREETTFFYGNEEMVVDEGNYRLIYGPDSTVEVGKYMNVWRKVDGEWKMGTNMWNSSRPAE